MKVFLSHSSLDKHIVEPIAKELGNPKCNYDSYTFQTAEDFIESIRKGLSTSVLYVLFASKNSSKSLWVDFELYDAEIKYLVEKSIKKVIVYFIDTYISIDDLPPWLKNAKIEQVIGVNFINRSINKHFDEELKSIFGSSYIERHEVIQEAQKKLFGNTDIPHTNSLCIYGLSGIGKKTFLSRHANSLFNFEYAINVSIEDGCDLVDLYIKLAAFADIFKNEGDISKLISEKRVLPTEKIIEEICTVAEKINKVQRTLIIFSDDGGLLDDDGILYEDMQLFFNGINKRSIFFTLIGERRPLLQESLKMPFLYIKEMDTETTILLLNKINSLQIHKNDIPKEKMLQIANIVGGYPPTAFQAISLINEKGIGVLLSNEDRIKESRRTYFSRFIVKSNITDVEKQILQLLNSYSPLPYETIVACCNGTAPEIDTSIEKLINNSLILLHESGYKLSTPVKEAIAKEYGQLSPGNHQKISLSIADYASKLKNKDLIWLDAVRVSFYSAAFCGIDVTKGDYLYLQSDIVKIAEELYHNRQYELSAKYGEIAVNECRSQKAISFYIKALIQENEIDLAKTGINKFENKLSRTEKLILNAFLFRKIGEIDKAIDSYERAFSAGRRGQSIYRELAHCYLIIGEKDKALEFAKNAISKTRNNKYVYDLLVKIYLVLGDIPSAKNSLDYLQISEDGAFYYHRESHFYYRQQDYITALESIDTAIEKAEKYLASPVFEMYILKFFCLVDDGKIDDAEGFINEVRKKFPKKIDGMILVLHSKVWLARKKYKRAYYDYIEKMNNTQRKQWVSLEISALNGMLAEDTLRDSECDAFKKRLSNLKSRHNKYDEIDFVL